MLEVVTSIAKELLGFVPTFLLSHFWPEKKLASRLLTTVRGEGEGICIDGGEAPSFYAWIAVQNLTPFTVELDRLYGDVFCGGKISSFVWLERKEVKPLETVTVRVQADLTDGQARLLARTMDKDRIRLTIGGYATCRVRGFALFGREIATNNARVMNVK